MSSVRVEVLTRFLAALNTGTPNGVPAAEPFRTFAVDDDVVPCISARWSNERVREPGGERGSLALKSLAIFVDFYAVPDAGARPDQAIDPMYLWAVQALEASGNLGGYVHAIVEGDSELEVLGADRVYVKSTTAFHVKYQARRSDAGART